VGVAIISRVVVVAASKVKVAVSRKTVRAMNWGCCYVKYTDLSLWRSR
jgi:hypothetical protein